MGKRGPAPAPRAVKELRGERRDRINDAEPMPSAGDVVPPAWLGAEARELWHAYAPDLVTQRVLTPWDVEAFAIWCDAAARRRRAVEMLAKEGELIKQPVFDRNGVPRGERLIPSPWLKILADADAQVQRYAARFGLTPSDRSQLSMPDKGEEDDLLGV